MRHPFDLDDFESFLSEQADKHRMYAGDRVWRNIQEQLHGIDKWPALTFASILTVALIAVTLTITYPNKNLLSEANEFSFANNNAFIQSETRGIELIKTENKKIEDAVAVAADLPLAPINLGSDLKSFSSQGSNNTIHSLKVEVSNDYSQNEEPETNEVELIASLNVTEIEIVNNIGTETGEPVKTFQIISQHQDEESKSANAIEPKALATPDLQKDNIQDFGISESAKQDVFKRTTLAYGPEKNQWISASKSKIALQIYATPSISYRYLLEDKNFNEETISGPVAPYLTNSVNEFVRHQPKMGLEAGAAVLYKLSDNFRLKTGLQFNYRQFGIAAYAMRQAQPATLTLNRSNGVDSMVSYTRLSAQNGDMPVDLTSNFFQIAVPIGFDLKISQIKNVELFVSASSQLTYNLSSSSYIISSDFKNYISQPAELDRKFNINTAVEAFASLDAGGVTWQIGPQIRYQMLPGSKNAYPIREHLIDYGMKIGVIKRIK